MRARFLVFGLALAVMIVIANADIFNLDNNEVSSVSLDGTVVSLDLSANGVPACAKEVVIYARVATGWFSNGNTLGDLIIESGSLKRKLFFRTYKQSAWSYNDEYFTLPISADGIATAKIVTAKPVTGNFLCEVQVVGYAD